MTHLHILLHTYFSEQDPQGVVLVSPVDVTLSDTVVVQPDLLYIDEGIYIRTGAAATGSFAVPGFPGLVLDLTTLWVKTTFGKEQPGE